MSQTLLCADCRVPVEEQVENGKDPMAVCPKCGVSDTVDNAVSEAAEAFVQQLTDDTLKGFESIPQSPNLRVTVTKSPPKRYRFILE